MAVVADGCWQPKINAHHTYRDRAGDGTSARDALAVDDIADRAHGVFPPHPQLRSKQCVFEENTDASGFEGPKIKWHTPRSVGVAFSDSRDLRRETDIVIKPEEQKSQQLDEGTGRYLRLMKRSDGCRRPF